MNDTTMNDEQTWSGTPGGPVEKSEGMARRICLAGMGAMALAYDTAAETFDRLVERGERINEEMRQSAERLRQERTANRTRASEFVRTTMDSMLNAANLPSKSDVDTINVKLNILTRKLDDLEMGRARAAGTMPETPPSEPRGTVDEELGT